MLGFRADFAHTFGKISSRCLRLLPPETAHYFASMLMRSSLIEIIKPSMREFGIELATHLVGVGPIPHPIGLAAGFDKDALLLEQVEKLGFSFMEFGTVTPFAQKGNPRPRLLRSPEQRALVNRMGFNNQGADNVLKRVSKSKVKIPLGINAGINATTKTKDAIWDYINVLSKFANTTEFRVVNISSPNTIGLRSLGNKQFVRELAAALNHSFSRGVSSTWVKLDPDSNKKDFQALVTEIVEAGFCGLVLTNTHKVNSPIPGGLSGHPLAIPSTIRLEWAWEVHKGKVGMIGCGGIFSGLDIYEKLARGACAVELYTSLIYRGPWVVYEMLSELLSEMHQRDIRSLQEVIGSHYD